MTAVYHIHTYSSVTSVTFLLQSVKVVYYITGNCKYLLCCNIQGIVKNHFEYHVYFLIKT